VRQHVDAPPARVWELLADVTGMGRLSPECIGGAWLGGASGPSVGARFRGRNRAGWRRWSTTNEIVTCVPGEAIGWVTRAAVLRIARWEYRIAPEGGGCEVTEEWTLLEGPAMQLVGAVASGVRDRRTHNEAGMRRTLAELRVAAERT
jgi:hypothetical protein